MDLAYSTPIPVGSKWFPDKRGLVVGLMVAGYGGGSAIFIPVGNALIERFGWRPTFQIIGVVLFVMCMVGTWLLKNPPAGYQPEGWSPQAAPAERTLRDIPTGEMVGKPTLLRALGGLLPRHHRRVDDHQPPQLVPFTTSAGMAAGAAGLAGALGQRERPDRVRRAVGHPRSPERLADHGPGVGHCHAGAVFSGANRGSSFYLLVFVVYWCFGTQLSVFATTAADFFGTKHMGLNYGLLFTAYGVAGLIGPYIAGRVFDASGDYRNAFFIAAASLLSR